MNSVTANQALGPVAAHTGWQAEFCDRYALLMLAYGRWFLLVGLLIGIAGAVAMLVNLFRQPARPAATAEEGLAAGPAGVAVVADAIKGVVQAFSRAPIWLAMFGVGALLLWMAGNAVPSYCTGVPDRDVGYGAPGAADQNVADGADNVADNGSVNPPGPPPSGVIGE